jgi:hypothetical protein
MKLAILMTAISVGLSCTARADNYDTLAAKGYRWVDCPLCKSAQSRGLHINGVNASPTEQGLERISNHRSGRTESQTLKDGQAFCLKPGKIVQIIKEDWAAGMSQVQMEGSTKFLWTYSRFLSKRPTRDTHGVIETPENSALVPNPSHRHHA